MRIIPVMDLKGGQVVHAVAGRRDEYRPIQSQLVDSSNPEAIARAFHDQLGLDDLYLADLDAIAGAEPAFETYSTLASIGVRLMVDAGVHNPTTARAVQAAGATGVVVGLETTSDPGLIRTLVDQLGADTIWFSLDLRDGKPICNSCHWQASSPNAIADVVIDAGVVQFIVLDLAHVGLGGGTGTENLCSDLMKRHPTIRLIAGGGIRDAGDLRRLEAIGVAGALVATAIHARRLPL